MKRPSSITDAYGNTVDGPLTTIKTVQMLVAPLLSDEPRLLGRSAIEVNYNLYYVDVAVSGILATDTLTVRGEDTPVDGRISSWKEPPYGEHIQVKLVNG